MSKEVHKKLEAYKIPKELIGFGTNTRTSADDEKDMKELITSIKRIGQISPISVKKVEGGKFEVIADNRRLKAIKSLEKTTLVHCIIVKNANDDFTAKKIQYDENAKRTDLSWYDDVMAFYALYKCIIKKAKDADENLKDQQIAGLMAVSASTVSTKINLYEKLLECLEVKPEIKDIKDLKDVRIVMDKILSKKHGDMKDNIAGDLDKAILGDLDLDKAFEVHLKTQERDGAVPVDQDAKPKISQQYDVIQSDFYEWLEFYNGPKFNLFHLDPPYGVGMDSGGLAQHKQKQTMYEDKPEDYFRFLEALTTHKNKIFSMRSQILLWFSMKFYSETIAHFATKMPELIIEKVPMVWVKTCGTGTAPDYRRLPKRNMEFCLFMTFPDGRVDSTFNAGIATKRTPDGEKLLHNAEKPMMMLEKYLFPLINKDTNLLDPTCGAGSSIALGKKFNANSALGIELDPEWAAAAKKRVEDTSSMNLGLELDV